jgi:NADPH:quinone reductase
MKAVRIHRFGDPEVLQYEDVPLPEAGPGQVRIKVAGAGVNFADLMRRMGGYGTVDLPNIPGLEAAGMIDAIGVGVTGFKPGQHVMTRTAGSGGYAEYLVVDAANVFPCPADVDLVETGGMPVVFLTAYHLLKTRGQMKAGDMVLIQAAASGVGTIATQLAKRWGAQVIATASAEDKLALARSLGADHTINYVTHDFEEEIQRLTNGAGVQVILECVGGEVLEKSLRCLAPYGRLVTYGNASGKAAYLPAAEIFAVNRSVIGFSIGRSPQGSLDHHAAMAEMLPLLEAKQVRLIVDHMLPMADVAKAHAHLANRGTRGKVILLP